MVAHASPRHLANRQVPTDLPTNIEGLIPTAVVATDTATTFTGLAADTITGTTPQTAPPLASNAKSIPTTTTSNTSTGTTVPSAASGSTSPIPMSTVIASCIGALIGSIAFILLGLWFYRRYARSLKKYSKSRGRLSLAKTRNIHTDQERARSRSEPWNKLEEGDDKWEGMYQTKEVDNVAPMEKLTMFKKSPSVRTAYTHKSEEPTTFDSHTFEQYHPHLAEELASKATDMPVPRPFLARVDSKPAISWDSDGMGNGSFLSVHSNRLSGGAMSPTLNMAIPTPPATSSHPHRWESAEVVHLEDDQSVDTSNDNNPFGNGSERRKSSSNNPFFKGQEHVGSNTYSHLSSRSSFSSVLTTPRIPKAQKGKERAFDDDPFSDGNAPPFPFPFAATHTAQGSLSSVSSNDRAMQSLIAALDISEEEVQERLRVASMQPSIVSANSAYTEEEDVSRSFPLPPSTDGGHPDKQ